MDLRHMYSTSQVETTIRYEKGKDVKVNTMKTHIVTPSGRYEEKEWEKLLIDQAKKLCELDIIDKLKEYALNTCAWINKEKDAYDYALKMYSSKMYKNTKWIDYEEFQSIIDTNVEVTQISLL
ncbi:hypothetical protein [Paraclostridium bifermentans]|uniref:hypothetical protein n=1 Tax=Paraclostridium bifermentans TaxID=1490 RepID=UPI0025AF88BE|nr:hypothetical protein [Paraclostridium bifermentans]